MSASGIKTDSSSPYLSSSIRRAGSFLPLSFGSQRAQLDSGNTLKHKALIGVASFVTVLSLSLSALHPELCYLMVMNIRICLTFCIFCVSWVLRCLGLRAKATGRLRQVRCRIKLEGLCFLGFRVHLLRCFGALGKKSILSLLPRSTK